VVLAVADVSGAISSGDARLSNSREWSAATATQAEAEAGTSTTRLAFTPLRVFQAVAAWWAASAAATKLSGIASGATANATDAQLRDRATHTGTQAASTITGLGTLATQSGTFSGTSSGTNTGDQTISLTGEITGSGTGSFAATVANSAVIGKLLTGYTSGAGTVAATDTILQAIQKLNGNDAAFLTSSTAATTYQPLDNDLTSIAALSTASAGRSLLTLAAVPSGTLVGTTDAQTLTSKTLGSLQESLFTITDAAGFEINPANGPIQTITLGANRTPAATNFASGQSVKLKVDDGTAYAITWTTVGVVWVGQTAGSSGAAPTLGTTGWTHIELWKEGSIIYGALIGYSAT
jgi:hypothetical protein